MRNLVILLLSLTPLFAGYSVDSLTTSFASWDLRTYQADERVEQKIKESLSTKPGLQNIALAEVAYKNGQYDKARDYLVAACHVDPSLVSVAQRRLGDLYLELGQKGAALEAFSKASAATSVVGYKKYLDKRAKTIISKYREEIQASGWNIAFEIDSAITEFSPRDTLKELWQQKLAQEFTTSLVDSLIAQSSLLGGKREALLLLQDTSKINDTFPVKMMLSLAEDMYSLRMFNTTAKWLAQVEMRSPLETAEEKRLGLLGARYFFDQAEWKKAISYADRVLKSGDNAELLFLVARCYRKLEESDKANAYYLRHITSFPLHPNSDDIMWYLGWEYEESGRYDSASIFFAQLSKKINFKNAPDAALRVGFVAYRQAKYSEAITAFKTFKSSFPKSTLVPGSIYWLARTYTAMDSTQQADSLYRAVIALNPLGYYAWRSREHVSALQDPRVTIETVTEGAWLQTLRKQSSSRVESQLTPAELEQLTLVLFLGSLGGYEQEREMLLKPLEKTVSKDLENGYAMAHYLFKEENYQRSYWFARQVYYSLPQGERHRMSLSFMKVLFPEAYKKSVEIGAQLAKVDQMLVWGIMRQESMFHPTIKSPVGAIGLLQVMPATGKMIADQLDTLFTVEMLSIPRVNVRFGSFYIAQRLNQYNGAKEQAIAAYNGGAHNVNKWVAKNQSILHDPALFTECIGFSETRDYVKKVLENYWMYQYIASLTTSGAYSSK